MSVEAVFKDLTKVELVGILCDLVFDDELFARLTVAAYHQRVASEEVSAIGKRQQRALDRDDFNAYNQLERLRRAAQDRAKKAWDEYERYHQAYTRQKERDRPTLEPELEGAESGPLTSSGRSLVAGERVVVDIAEAEFDDQAPPLPHRPIGLPHRPARLENRRAR